MFFCLKKVCFLSFFHILKIKVWKKRMTNSINIKSELVLYWTWCWKLFLTQYSCLNTRQCNYVFCCFISVHMEFCNCCGLFEFFLPLRNPVEMGDVLINCWSICLRFLWESLFWHWIPTRSGRQRFLQSTQHTIQWFCGSPGFPDQISMILMLRQGKQTRWEQKLKPG